VEVITFRQSITLSIMPKEVVPGHFFSLPKLRENERSNMKSQKQRKM